MGAKYTMEAAGASITLGYAAQHYRSYNNRYR